VVVATVVVVWSEAVGRHMNPYSHSSPAQSASQPARSFPGDSGGGGGQEVILTSA
jgi:hypothetical protein